MEVKQGPSPIMVFLPPEQPAAGMRLEKGRLDGGAPRPPFGLSRFTLDPGSSTALDSHPDSEVWFIGQGDGELVYAGNPGIPVRSGDILRFEPFRSHILRNSGEGPLTAFSVWWV